MQGLDYKCVLWLLSSLLLKYNVNLEQQLTEMELCSTSYKLVPVEYWCVETDTVVRNRHSCDLRGQDGLCGNWSENRCRTVLSFAWRRAVLWISFRRMAVSGWLKTGRNLCLWKDGSLIWGVGWLADCASPTGLNKNGKLTGLVTAEKGSRDTGVDVWKGERWIDDKLGKGKGGWFTFVPGKGVGVGKLEREKVDGWQVWKREVYGWQVWKGRRWMDDMFGRGEGGWVTHLEGNSGAKHVIGAHSCWAAVGGGLFQGLRACGAPYSGGVCMATSHTARLT